ncbi:MAG: hypothetical protein LBD04_08665 [Synergistaceae bacterium]|nr:hypothetical protein [Synergistaceae bacterium]
MNAKRLKALKEKQKAQSEFKQRLKSVLDDLRSWSKQGDALAVGVCQVSF